MASEDYNTIPKSQLYSLGGRRGYVGWDKRALGPQNYGMRTTFQKAIGLLIPQSAASASPPWELFNC